MKLGVHTEDYSVLALEYGEPKYDDLQVADDEDFVWEPYVMSVADFHTSTTDLLDGATGQPLSGGDLVEAAHRLDFFAQQISDEAYECFIRGYDEELTIEAVPLPTDQNRTLQAMFREFDHQGTHEELYELHDCFPGCPIETHSQSSQN